MLYGAIASAEVRVPILSENLLFHGAGNLSASASIVESSTKFASALFAGAGNMTANLRNPAIQGSALFVGAGGAQVAGVLSNPFWQGSASLTGTGNLAASGFIRFPPNVADWEFDDGTGDTLTDSVGANNGTLVNSPSWVAGKTGTALSFNGTTQCVTVGTFDPIPAGTTGSISVWLKPSSFASGNRYVLAKGDDVTVNSWGLNSGGNGTAGNVSIMYLPSLIAGHSTGYVVPNDGNLHHIVAIFGAVAERKIYVDNVDQSLSSFGSPPSTHISNSALGLNIAKTTRAAPYTYFYGGLIDNLKIFNRALTADEVSGLYNFP